MLVTCFVPAYNRGYCIERTLDAMLSLDIPEGWEMEYVWSDDNSTDDTWEKILSKAEENNNRGFNIITSRNSKNLRLGRHVEKIMTLGHGEWFVEFDSDDIPSKTRLLEIAKCMKQYPKMLGFSSGVTVKEVGKPSHYSGVLGKQLFACGATCAWHKDVFQKFSPVKYETGSQDIFIPFRALLLGGQWVWSDTSTIIYGVDETNDSTPSALSQKDSLRHLGRLKANWINALKQRLADMEEVQLEDNKLERDLFERHNHLIEKLTLDISQLNYLAQYLEATFVGKLNLFRQLPLELRQCKRLKIRLLLYLFPMVAKAWTYFKGGSKNNHHQEMPTGKTFMADLSFFKQYPEQYLMML